MRFRGPILLSALAAALVAPHGAAAARAAFAPCGRGALECATVNVPLDRSGGTPGTVSLYVERLAAGGTPRGVMFLIAGGPGQASAGAFDLASNGAQFRDQFPGYTLIAFDPRGTGRSGVLRCPELQSDPSASPAREQALVAKCATEIGATRAFYSTRDHADDIDAVRQALGRDKIALWGTSYGTQLSVAYALTYPSHVDRLVLDSVADAAGRDPFSLDDLQQMPKGLASLCSGGLCRAATSNFVGELVKLANRLGTHPLTGRVPKPGGGTVTVTVSGADFLSGAVIDSDLNAGLAAELPAAVHAALHGRARPVLRLVQLDRETSVTSTEELSMGLLAATVCDAGPFPWQPETPLSQRAALLAAARHPLPPVADAREPDRRLPRVIRCCPAGGSRRRPWPDARGCGEDGARGGRVLGTRGHRLHRGTRDRRALWRRDPLLGRDVLALALQHRSRCAGEREPPPLQAWVGAAASGPVHRL